MIKNVSYRISFVVSLFTLLFFFLFTTISVYSMLGISLFMFFSVKFFFDMSKTIDVRDLMIVFALLQWIIGPILAYHFVTEDPIFYMSVDEETYMGFIFPATLFFAIGMYIPIFKKKINEKNILILLEKITAKYPNLDLILFFSGIVIISLWEIAPQFLKFFIYLTSNIRFVGLYLIFIHNRPYKWLYFILFMLSMLAGAVESALFHDMVLWMSFSMMALAFILNFSTTQKTTILGSVLLLVLLIQIGKPIIRDLNPEERDVQLFYDETTEKLYQEEYIFSEGFINYNISRMNQGWIITRIMSFVPTYEPFADGETIWKGIKGSLLPRFLDPEGRVSAGNSEYFYRFTGLQLAAATSMDISIIGEAYANYGINGGILFMFILGLFYNSVLHYVLNLSQKYPLLLLMLPILFFHVVKAETDFTSSMNYLIKASMVVVSIYLGLRQILGMDV